MNRHTESKQAPRLARVAGTLTLAVAATFAMPAFADCGASNTPAQARASYRQGQQLEQAGRTRDALAAYVAAQEYTCEANPVEADAARRAAALAPPLATAAEQRGDLALAYELYESGALYAEADRVLLAHVRARADDVGLWDRAREHFANRALPAFQANERVRLAVAGAYAADPAALAEILAMPAKRHAATLAREASAFDERFLQQRVAAAQQLPADPTDTAALARLQAQQAEFARRWPQDPVKTSRDLLSLARDWTSRVPEAESKALERQTRDRYEQRAEALASKYAGAPKSLEDAMDYHRAATFGDRAVLDPRLARLRAQAAQLGASAEQAGKLELAAQYYGVAGQDARAAAARDKQRALAMAKLRPQLEEAQRDAAALAKRFEDPAAVEALRRQAEAANAALAKQKEQGRKNQAGNDALARELGL